MVLVQNNNSNRNDHLLERTRNVSECWSHPAVLPDHGERHGGPEGLHQLVLPMWCPDSEGYGVAPALGLYAKGKACT